MASYLACLADPLIAAAGGQKALPATPSNWNGWAVMGLEFRAWTRTALLVDEDGLGEPCAKLEYACAYGAEQTSGSCVRTRSQLLRLHAALVHDSPGSLVAAGVDVSARAVGPSRVEAAPRQAAAARLPRAPSRMNPEHALRAT